MVDHDDLKHLIFQHLLSDGVLLSFHTDQATTSVDIPLKTFNEQADLAVFSYHLRTTELKHNGLGVTAFQRYQNRDFIVYVPWRAVVSISAHHFNCNWQFSEEQQAKRTSTKPQLRLV